MGNKLAVRTNYFKTTQARGEMAHVMRLIAEDKNVLDERLTKGNFGTRNEVIFAKWGEALELMPEHTQNTLIDSVLVLPLEQINKVKAEHGKEWGKELNKAIRAAMAEMEQELGFKALGFRVHMDEGHWDENGKAVINPHAHMLFANVCDNNAVLQKTQKITQKGADGKALRDPENPSKYLYARDENGEILTETKQIPLKGRSPLSLLQTRGSNSAWAKQQDIAAKHLSRLGFARGDKKELTNRKHKTKKQWVSEQAEAMLDTLKATTMAQCEQFLNIREQFFDALRADKNDLARQQAEKMEFVFEKLPQEVQKNALESTARGVNDMQAFIPTPALKAAQEAINRLQQAHNKKAGNEPTSAQKMKL